jgi:MazG family protein
MVRRHPHVFGEKRAKDAAEVLKNWEQIKSEERRAQGAGREIGAAKLQVHAESLMAGIARSLPATMEGLQLTRRAARIGFDWHEVEGIFEKIREEGAELRHALGTEEQAKVEEEMGDLLFAAVNLARFVHVDPEIALKKANAKFARRFRAMEQIARDSGSTLESVSRPEMEALWEAAKRNEQLTSAGVADEVPRRK